MDDSSVSADIQSRVCQDLLRNGIRHFSQICSIDIVLVGQSIFDKSDCIGEGGDNFIFLSAG